MLSCLTFFCCSCCPLLLRCAIALDTVDTDDVAVDAIPLGAVAVASVVD